MERKFQKVGELFCGPGGGGIGASLSSFTKGNCEFRIKHEWATDIDKDSRQTYEDNISEFEKRHFGLNAPPKVLNVDINDEQVNLEDASQFSKVDGLIFGFPCNDFSIVESLRALLVNLVLFISMELLFLTGRINHIGSLQRMFQD